jgi:hypothetical protein
MLTQLLETELFTKLSLQEEEMMTGGGTGSSEDLKVNDPSFKLHKQVATFFDDPTIKILNTGASGPGGSLSGVQIKKT